MLNKNGEWDFVGNETTTSTIKTLSNFLFSEIIFNFHLKRRTTYYLLNVIGPLVMVGKPILHILVL